MPSGQYLAKLIVGCTCVRPYLGPGPGSFHRAFFHIAHLALSDSCTLLQTAQPDMVALPSPPARSLHQESPLTSRIRTHFWRHPSGDATTHPPGGIAGRELTLHTWRGRPAGNCPPLCVKNPNYFFLILLQLQCRARRQDPTG